MWDLRELPFAILLTRRSIQSSLSILCSLRCLIYYQFLFVPEWEQIRGQTGTTPSHCPFYPPTNKRGVINLRPYHCSGTGAFFWYERCYLQDGSYYCYVWCSRFQARDTLFEENSGIFEASRTTRTFSFSSKWNFFTTSG